MNKSLSLLSIQEARSQLPPGFVLTKKYASDISLTPNSYIATHSGLGVRVNHADLVKLIHRVKTVYVALCQSGKSAKYGTVSIDPQAVDFQSIEQASLVTGQHSFQD